jgi:lysophospholipase-2
MHNYPPLAHMDILLPTAPYNHDSMCNAWFAAGSFNPVRSGFWEDDFDGEGMRESVRYVEGLIDAEVKERGVDPSRVVVGGFSQGCCLSLLLGCGTGGKYGGKVGGVVALSGMLPPKELMASGSSSATGSGIEANPSAGVGEAAGAAAAGDGEKSGAEASGPSNPSAGVGEAAAAAHDNNIKEEHGGDKMRIFIGHGTRDQMVPMRCYRAALEWLENSEWKAGLEAQAYEGQGHATSGKELMDMCRFLEKVVPA